MQTRHRQSQPVQTKDENTPLYAEEVILDGRDKKAVAKDASMMSGSEVDVTTEYKSYQALIDRTIDVFGDELVASRWLSIPSVDLNGEVPLQVARKLHYDRTELDKIFEPIFIRIEHGIYG